MIIGVLALQGDFAEHEKKLTECGAECFEIRQLKDLERDFDGLVLPGGESTVIGKLLRELNLLGPLKEKINSGLPVLATCAGMILLADSIEGGEMTHFATMNITVKRNAFGRQLGSFNTTSEIKHIGNVPMTFIRAPYITECHDAEILAEIDGKIVAAQQGNQIALAFHPELDECNMIYEYFLSLC